MINFEKLEPDVSKMSYEFFSATPFEHIIIDNFCNEKNLSDAIGLIPDAQNAGHNKSNILKRFLGKHMPKLVSVKTQLFGSGTT
tara:strand:+ start:412 stop:663 length:252 start_codon:yes stop_codon:yes gene_type:complete